MDIPRPEHRRRKHIRKLIIGGGVILLLAIATVVLARLGPSAPAVPRATVWVDTVREGEMLREVRGNGTLAPREIRWIAAQADGRIDRIITRPGAVVEPDTVLMEMSNPDLLQEAEEARYEAEAAEARATETKLKLNSQQLDQRAALAVARAEYKGAQMQADAEKKLVDEGIVPMIQYQRSELLAEQLKIRMEIEEDRLEQFSAAMAAQIALQRARVEQARNAYERRAEQVESLRVIAGAAGVLQQVLVEEGQRVALGANIARVARPDELRAELRVAETQARDIQVGQSVKVDMRNAVIDGRVMRIDPAVLAGTVQVDVELLGKLPRGARPDLSVEGTIEIERVPRTLFTGRPAHVQPNATINLFRVVDKGRHAERVAVQIGRASVDAVEIAGGLAVGDQIILSDTSAWDDHDRIRLN